MVIVVNTPFWEEHTKEGIDEYIKEWLLQLMLQHPAHRFYLLSNTTINAATLPANVTNLVVRARKNQILRKYWHQVQLPQLVKKLNADVYIATVIDTLYTSNIRQCIIVKEWEAQPPQQPSSSIHMAANKSLRRAILKAKIVVVPSLFLKQEIEKQTGLPESRLQVLRYAVPEAFKPVSYELKESVKALYAQGHEYFVYKGLIDADYNLINLLKAFSLFKKRQQSSWKLVLAGVYKEGTNTFATLLETYKYKEDVFVTGPINTTEQAEIIGSAYALVSPSLHEKRDVAIGEAMQCHVPVLAAGTATNKEVSADSILYFDGQEPSDIAEKLMHIYKDEKERSRLIESGKQLLETQSWEEAVQSLWRGIKQAANA